MTIVCSPANANVKFVHIIQFAIGGFGTQGTFSQNDVGVGDAEMFAAAAAVAAVLQVWKMGEDEGTDGLGC